MMIIEQVSKSYKKHKVLEQVNLQIPSGLFGLLGPNGAGKTTLMRIIATIIQSDSGEISFNGLKWTKNPEEVRKILGYLPQEFDAFRNVSAWECLDYIAILKGIHNRIERYQQIETLLKEVNLLSDSKRKVGKFSGGMKRRLGIAQAFLGNPQIVMVDEPTSGLDPEERIRFRSMLRRLAENRTIILSTHIVEDIQTICDRVAVLKNGVAHSFSSLHELASFAQNKVWCLKIKENEYEYFERHYKVISVQTGLEGTEVRLLSDTRPSVDARLVEPTVEEGYLTWINT